MSLMVQNSSSILVVLAKNVVAVCKAVTGGIRNLMICILGMEHLLVTKLTII